ncbi:MAG: RNA polymerase sigma factor [Planctomycetes bacterium]|nr:RNA polymerase sigma factor [Planctomycetota bacterium]
MARCRLGDTAAFETLLDRWQRPIARLLERLTASGGSGATGGRGGRMLTPPLSMEVEDLAQEVFLRVLEARERYDERGAFSTWIYRIALNVTRDAARRRRSRWRRLVTWRPTTGGEPASPGEQVSRVERAAAVNAALAALPRKLREPLVLRHFGGLTFAETADVLGTAASTVKSRLKQGLLRLRAELARRGIDEREFES